MSLTSHVLFTSTLFTKITDFCIFSCNLDKIVRRYRTTKRTYARTVSTPELQPIRNMYLTANYSAFNINYSLPSHLYLQYFRTQNTACTNTDRLISKMAFCILPTWDIYLFLTIVGNRILFYYPALTPCLPNGDCTLWGTQSIS